MTYQGHLADGSSVQKHSAGALYPLVLVYTEKAGYYFLCPNGLEIKTISGDFDAAHKVAEAYIRLKSILH